MKKERGDKTKKKSMMDNFENDNIDENLLKDLKRSIAPDSLPSSPVSGMFKPISKEAIKNGEPLNDILLKIEEGPISEKHKQASISMDTFEENKLLVESPIKNKNEVQNYVQNKITLDDDVSLLTTESDSKKSEPTVSENQKPKRKYTPRKKKGDV